MISFAFHFTLGVNRPGDSVFEPDFKINMFTM